MSPISTPHLISVKLDGEMYVDLEKMEDIDLFDEISSGRGQRFGLMETRDVGYIYESPTLVVGDTAIFGAAAIRSYLANRNK